MLISCGCVRPYVLRIFVSAVCPDIIILNFLTDFSHPVFAVPVGGYLFECYLYSNSSYAVNRLWYKYLSIAQDNPEGKLQLCQNEELLDQSSGHFMGYLLFALGNIGSNGRGQLFYHTLACNFYGLSRDGIHYLSRYGFAANIRSFDVLRQEAYNRSVEMTRSISLYVIYVI